MMNLFRSLGAIGLVVASVSVSLASSAQMPVVARPAARGEQALLDREAQRFDAQVKRDVPALAAALADDVSYIHASGVVQTKAEYLHDVEAGVSRYRSIESADRSARLYGNIAVTHGAVTLNVGVDRRITTRYTGVYVKRGGKWLLLSWQSTPNGGPARQ